MLVKICIAERIKDIITIYKSKDTNSEIICLPLNLETFLYCKNNNIKFLDPINFIKNEFHKNTLVEGEKFVNSIVFNTQISKTLSLEIKSLLRHRFYSVLFIYELFQNIRKKYDIDYIMILKNNFKNHGYHSSLIDDISTNLLNDITLKKLENNEKEIDTSIRSYKIDTVIKKNKKNILFNSIGYNFKRIILSKIFNFKYNFYTFNDGQEKKINLFKKIIFKMLKINILNFNSDKNNLKRFSFIKSINYNFMDKKIEKTIFLLSNKLENFFLDFYYKNIAINNFLKSNNFSLILVSNVKNIGGFITEYKNDKVRSPSVCIPHGIISEKFDNYDEIYKKIIASAVFSGSSDYFAIQSKIAEKSLNTHSFEGKKIITGNILFSENYIKIKKKPKQILFAVTLKQFTNLQFLGVEMYYEFIKNLEILSKLSSEKKIGVIVKIHPSESKCINLLKKQFKNLIFTNDKIDKLFKICSATVSYSSSVIEDSLHNRVPVILFDQWKRYVQCKSKNNSDKKALYYTNNYNELSNAIDKILVNQEFDFDEFIFKTYSKENINKKVLELIK